MLQCNRYKKKGTLFEIYLRIWALLLDKDWLSCYPVFGTPVANTTNICIIHPILWCIMMDIWHPSYDNSNTIQWELLQIHGNSFIASDTNELIGNWDHFIRRAPPSPPSHSVAGFPNWASSALKTCVVLFTVLFPLVKVKDNFDDNNEFLL